MTQDARKNLFLANPSTDRKSSLPLGQEASMALTHRQGSSFLLMALPRTVRLEGLYRRCRVGGLCVRTAESPAFGSIWEHLSCHCVCKDEGS